MDLFAIDGALQDAAVVGIGRDSPGRAMGCNHSLGLNDSLRALLSSTT